MDSPTVPIPEARRVVMLNQALRSHGSGLPALVSAPSACDNVRNGAFDRTVTRVLRLPASATLDRLLIDEIHGLDPLLTRWSSVSGQDIRRLYFRNSVTKRALYLSLPLFLPDTLGDVVFPRKGVNSRVYLFLADTPRNIVRLEAIDTITTPRHRYRYALAIQYSRDSLGRSWQLLRPTILLEPVVQELIEGYARERGHEVPLLLHLLRRIILVGMHDYVHATVLRWFPAPGLDLPAGYREILSERPNPPELDIWHREADVAWPSDFGTKEFRSNVVPIELYSLLVHADIYRVDGRGAGLEGVLALGHRFLDELDTFVAATCPSDSASAFGLDSYLASVAGWFLACVLPLGTPELEELFLRRHGPTGPRVDVLRLLSRVHGGMFHYLTQIPRSLFPWGGERLPLHDVSRRYEAALRLPALRTHLSYLLGEEEDVRPGGLLGLVAEVLREEGGDAETAGDLAALAVRLPTLQAALAFNGRSKTTGSEVSEELPLRLRRLANALGEFGRQRAFRQRGSHGGFVAGHLEGLALLLEGGIEAQAGFRP